MKMKRADVLVSDLCAEIDRLKKALKASQQKEQCWQQQYDELLHNSLQHNTDMMGNYLDLLLVPGVEKLARTTTTKPPVE
jgi:hypothetical protein